MDYKNIKKIIAVVLVIAVIIGIIVGFRYAFTPPCVQTDYIRYTDYNNVCGPECTGDKKAMPVYDDNKEISGILCCDTYICTDKNSKYYNKCVPSGLCSNKGYPLIDNKDNCNCKKDCSKNDDYPTSFPTKGTDMKKLNDGSYVPEDETYCGFDCEYDKTNGFCSLDAYYYGHHPTTKKLLCGYVEDNKGRIGNSGCFNPDDYQTCGNNGVICRKSGDSTCDTDTGYCKNVSCPKNEGYVCAEDKDCRSSNVNDEENNKYYCDKNNNTLIDKGITKIGVCMYDNGKGEKPTMKTNIDKFDINRCSNVDYISYKNKYNGIGFLKCNPKDTEMCTDSELCVGYNLDINCDNEVKDACAKFGLCDNNGWQAKIDKSETGCLDDKTPPVNKSHEICCNVDNLVDVVDEKNNIVTCKTSEHCGDLGSCMDGKCKYCCSQPGTKINGKTLCANITEYGYSKGLLGESKDMDEKITCKYDSDCTHYNNDLYENLGISKDEPPTYDNMNYSTLYCDPKEKVCKAMCGYVNQNNNNTSPFLTSNVSKHIKNSVDKTSFCYQDTKGCTLTTPVFNYGTVNNIPICKSIEHTDDDTRLWWSKDINSKKEYNTSFHMDFINTDKNQSCSDKGSGLCLGLAKGLDDVQKVYINDTGNGGKCTFDINCLNDNFFITDTSEDPNKLLKWSDLSNPKNKDGLLNIKNNPDNKDNPTWATTEQLISQTSPTDKNCIGDSHGFGDDLTYNIYEKRNIGDINICRHKTGEKKPQLLYTGEYCVNGVDAYNNICIK